MSVWGAAGAPCLSPSRFSSSNCQGTFAGCFTERYGAEHCLGTVPCLSHNSTGEYQFPLVVHKETEAQGGQLAW